MPIWNSPDNRNRGDLHDLQKAPEGFPAAYLQLSGSLLTMACLDPGRNRTSLAPQMRGSLIPPPRISALCLPRAGEAWRRWTCILRDG